MKSSTLRFRLGWRKRAEGECKRAEKPVKGSKRELEKEYKGGESEQ